MAKVRQAMTATDFFLLQGGWLITTAVAVIIGFKVRDWTDQARDRLKKDIMQDTFAEAKAGIENNYEEGVRI